MTLHELDWNGYALRLRAQAGASLTLEMDGCDFAPLSSDTAGAASLALPFSPSGHAQLNLRLLRDGAVLHAPFGVRLGEAGLRAAQAPAPLAPIADDEWVDPGTILREFTREAVIVVPVYNAPELVRACLESVLQHTTGDFRVVMIDDASTNAGVARLLAEYAMRPRCTVLRNQTNSGFTATANRGIAEAADADVVLLNADTEVAPHWLDGLRRAAYTSVDTASATAVSDNAGAFSVPQLEAANAFPQGWSFQDAAQALWHDAGSAYPRLPTGNGFCLYLKRAALREVGVLDEAAFPQGYGEENDWCQRAEAAGWRHVIAGNVLVRHVRSASFGDERRRALGEQGMAVLRSRWPRYESAVGATLFSFERRVLEWRVRRAYAAASPVPRVLHLDGADAGAAHAGAWRLQHEGALWKLQRRAATNAHWDVVAQRAVDPIASTHFSAAHPSERTLVEWVQRYGIDAVRGDPVVCGPRATRLLALLGLAASA